MMPMLPPSHIEELAREHLGSHARLHRANDRDGFLSAGDGLPQDPVFMALRRLVTTGPIGAVRVRIERWTGAREVRRHVSPGDDVLEPGGTVFGAESTLPKDTEPRIAA